LRSGADVEIFEGIPAAQHLGDEWGVVAPLRIGEPEPVVVVDAAEIVVVRWPNGHGASLPSDRKYPRQSKVGATRRGVNVSSVAARIPPQ
jgi:hypothetical protein